MFISCCDITLECPCLYKIEPCIIIVKNNFTTQFTKLMYKFKDLLPNCIIYKSNQIKPNMQHEINQSLKFSQSDL